ncbi:hypothetical protein EIP91_006497 [Steccherinum ochraceum]|uniref:Anaphase-promoting complex subunit 5 n=1 Tax=Steccherinum ochraceum TaxID=92696 RepID=A0A4R0RLX2_9APHY|nr:hypothetical protein EIP91_006497 [Steccherinum ochraceum]
MNPNSLPRTAEPGHPTPSHILKPHHLQLVKILDLTFRKYATPGKLPPELLLYLYRILMVELSEVKQPATYEQMVSAIENNPTKEESQDLVNEYKETHKLILSPEHLSIFFKDCITLVAGRDEEDDSSGTFERRSLFGFFIRRSFVSFVKLSFEAQSQLFVDYHAWIGKKFNPDSIRIRLDVLDNSYYLFKVHADKRQFAEVDPYAWYVKDDASGDTMNAEERLRCFFEQYFHEGSDSGMRQLALLHLARMHYVQHEYPACQKLLHEAINVARSHNDRLTLQHCLGLLHRIPEKGKRPVISEIQPDLHPYEILYDVKKLLQINNQQPMTATFDKITQVTALYDNWSDFQHHRPVPSEQWAQHAVQAVAWEMLGCSALATVHNRVVMSFTDPGGNDNTRLTAAMNYAAAYADMGNYEQAAALLIHPTIWAGLTMADYGHWAGSIWKILVLRASRRGQLRLYNEFLKNRRPNIPHNPREYWFGSETPTNSIIRDPLYDVLYMREKRQAHHYIEPLLTALWHAEFQQRWNLYRTALIMLADIGLEYGMAKWSRRILDEILPQIMTTTGEQKGLALVTYARCIIAAGESSPESLKESLQFLKEAETNFRTIQLMKALQDTQFLLATVYHNLGMEKDRDAASARCLATEDQGKKLATVATDDWPHDLWNLVSRIGAVIAAKT